MANKVMGLLLDILFPPRCPTCDAVLGFVRTCKPCEAALPAIRRPDAQVSKDGRALKFVARVYAGYWYMPPVRDAILRMKQDDRRDLQSYFALEMARSISQKGAFDGLVPVPSSRKEFRRRGYSLPHRLAEQLAVCTHIPVADVLQKCAETPAQMSLSGHERRANLLGAYAVRANADVDGKRFLLVDDVLTTGSTVNECAKTLLRAGASECCAVCIAVTRNEKERAR